jgi:hypothetical protein
MPKTEPARVNYLCKYVPEPKPIPWERPAVDAYTPTRAMLVLCHALRVTLDTLDVVLEDEEPHTMADLCADEIRDALRVMNVLELYGTHEGESVEVCDADAWLDWSRVPKEPRGLVERGCQHA